VGVLSQSEYPEEAQAFLDLMMSSDGQAILEKYGFIPVVQAGASGGSAKAATA
jgi:ABC-type molybdate transport system substrate-binding protein